MPDWIKQVLATLGGIGVFAGLLAFLIRYWLKSYVDHRFNALLEHEKAVIEVEKKSALDLLSKENAIYPELVELLYRIRNGLRESIEAIENHSGDFGSEFLGDLTSRYSEKLYSFRVFFDDETFVMLHQGKRSAQDAYLLLNKYTRPDGVRTRGPFGPDPNDLEFQRRTEETLPQLKACYEEINKQYEDVLPRIRSHMEGILRRDA